jgi:ADP-L-glycero-D-manno-heptose 6-epimerase
MSVVNAQRSLRGESALALEAMVSQGLLEYIQFPDALRGKYQCHTQADLSALRASGCMHSFADVQTGVTKYVQWLAQQA